MREEERVMLQLTGRALFGAKTDFTSADWFSVYRECCNQTLTILIWDTLSNAERAEIPADVAKMWEQDAWMHIMLLTRNNCT
ncbi:MAG: hypothetical protein LUD12_14990 [Lachnospiraceae bacterium]|nr:hypothetical protein [Lachnospiraceae bacterium]